VENSKNLAKQNDVIIFSPSCASFDMFKNYKDRGEKFKEAVSKLLSHESN
jgi:UDP-N-acetylmuramoylalanine--D-glutamate ligase